MPFTIRAAEPADAQAIAAVHVAGWQWGYRGRLPDELLDSLDVAERTEWWRSILTAELGPVSTHVAERDGRVVGFASCGPSRDDNPGAPAGEVFAIYLIESAAGTGAGTSLLRQAVEDLWGRFGFDAAFLWVLESNSRARRFYEREGWRPDGGTKTDELRGVALEEMRYRLSR